jgi:CheY-like chemotaxis protein
VAGNPVEVNEHGAVVASGSATKSYRRRLNCLQRLVVSVVYPFVLLSLVVDDDPAIRMYITAILQGEDFQVLEAESGVQALQIVEELSGGLDVIVSDVQMPNGDGLSLANALKNSLPAVSVILISGNASSDASFDVIAKPFSPGVLLQAVRGVIAP